MHARVGVFVRSLFAVVLLLAAAAAQQPTGLLGRWVGTGEDNQGEVLVFEKAVMVVDEDRVPYRAMGPGVLVLGGEGGERVEYAVQGDKLTLTFEGIAYPFRRDGAPPGPVDGPLPQPDNPLAKPPARDVFARTFRGDGIALELVAGAERSYRGELVFRGATYPCEATRAGDSGLDGRFRAGEQWFPFRASLEGDALALESGGTTYRMVGEPLAPAPPVNPLDPGGPGATPAPAKDAPPALTGVYDGKTARFEHPRGWFGFDMPEGWTVYQQGDAGMTLNPGFTTTDTPDALVFLMWGRLEPGDQDLPVAKVIEKHLPQMRQGLAQEGLTVGEPDGPVRTVRGKDVPGAVVTFRGRSAQGQQVRAWFGGIVKRDAWISVGGLVLEGKEEAYLPKVKRIFTSLEPKPPERNRQLEAALVGKSFSSSQYGRVTKSAFHASYSFAGGGSVTRRVMSNVISTPGLNTGFSTDSERTGRYEVCGDVLYLYFETGQEVGQVLQQAGQVNGIRIGNAEYR